MLAKYLAIATSGVAAAVIALGVGVAAAQPEANETPITGDAYAKATAAALEFAGGGTVAGTKADDQNSSYEVEVKMPDGRLVEVVLNKSFRVVSSKSTPPGMDNTDGEE